jgi:adenylate dimethylallyltransferase
MSGRGTVFPILDELTRALVDLRSGRGPGTRLVRATRMLAPSSAATRRLHLIYGPTGCGKTERASARARRTDAPVVVLDRIQCHPEVAVGSGRPSAEEVAGTRHVYLCERPLSAGELPPSYAHRLVMRHVGRLASPDGTVILEGGSVSLLRRMVRDLRWADFAWSSERISLPAPDEYLPSARARMREMLRPAAGGPGMLDELAAAWADPRTHATFDSIFTYRITVRALARDHVAVEQAPDIGSKACDRIAEELAVAVLAHARWQERELPDLPVSWTRSGERTAT